MLTAHWSSWQDLTDHLCTQNVGKCSWNSSSRTLKSLKRQISLVWIFLPVTITRTKARKAYALFFCSSKTILDQYKKFGQLQNILDMYLSNYKIHYWKVVFGSNPKQFGHMQNHLGPIERQSNSCQIFWTGPKLFWNYRKTLHKSF